MTNPQQHSHRSNKNLNARFHIAPNMYTADPAAHTFSDGKVWLYADRDPDRSNQTWWSMCDYHAFSSEDLEHWVHHGSVLNCDDISWCDGPAWDGDAIEYQGKYYYFFPMIDQIGVAIASQPQGPFRDAIGEPLISRACEGIGPRPEGGALLVSPVFVESPDGLFLYFGQCEELYVVELEPCLTRLKGKIHSVGHPKLFHEGPWVYHRDGLYHMIYGQGEISHDLKKQLDHLAYATATSPYGPFTYKNIVQRDQARTVQACLCSWKDQDILFYHEDGPDEEHRNIRAEIIPISADGHINEVQRGQNPIIPRTLIHEAKGRHEAEDFYGGSLGARKQQTEGERMGHLHLESKAHAQYHHWQSSSPLQTCICQVRQKDPRHQSRVSLEFSNGSSITCELPSSESPATWQNLHFPLPEALQKDLQKQPFSFRWHNPCDHPVELGSFRFQ